MNTRSLLFGFGLLAAVITGSYLYFTSGIYITTENAYLKFDKVMLGAEVSGTVTSLPVKTNQQVQKGDLLVTLDDATYKVALEKSAAQLKKAESYIKSLKASYHTKQAELALAANNLDFAMRGYQRELNLSKKNLTSEALIDERQHSLDIATQKTNIIEKQLAQLRANLNDDIDAPINEYSQVMEAQADLNLAAINLRHTQIVAPSDGVVSHLPNLGQHISTGSPVLSLVSNKDAWIEANFKETDLVGMRVGQSVKITIDAYPKLSWDGSVESLSPATGAEYSVLPPQNATGNWIKVVQRIPIRIRLEPHATGPILRAGMSAFVKIDTHQSSI